MPTTPQQRAISAAIQAGAGLYQEPIAIMLQRLGRADLDARVVEAEITAGHRDLLLEASTGQLQAAVWDAIQRIDGRTT